MRRRVAMKRGAAMEGRARRSARSASAAPLLLLASLGASTPLAEGPWRSLPAPKNLQGDEVGAYQVDLAWSGVQGAVHYTVYRDGQLVGRSALTFFSDTGLREDTDYEYRVRAVDAAGVESGDSKKVDVETEEDDDSSIDESPPSTPSSVSPATITTTRIDLAWAPASDPNTGVSEYRVFRNGILVARPGSASWNDAGLQPSTTYTYRIAAVNGDGKVGSASASLSVTTGGGADTSPPTAPAGLSATSVTVASVTLSWSAASDPESGVVSYNVYRDAAKLGISTGASFTDGAVSAATTYAYRVAAVNGAGLEGPAASTSVTTPHPRDTSPPTRPAGLAASATGPGEVDLSWQAAADAESGVAAYRLYRDGVRIAQIPSPRATAFSDTTVAGGISYRYEVSAVNGDGVEGIRSRPALVTTPAPVDDTPPAPPTALRIITP